MSLSIFFGFTAFNCLDYSADFSIYLLFEQSKLTVLPLMSSVKQAIGADVTAEFRIHRIELNAPEAYSK